MLVKVQLLCVQHGLRLAWEWLPLQSHLHYPRPFILLQKRKAHSSPPYQESHDTYSLILNVDKRGISTPRASRQTSISLASSLSLALSHPIHSPPKKEGTKKFYLMKLEIILLQPLAVLAQCKNGGGKVLICLNQDKHMKNICLQFESNILIHIKVVAS